MQISVTDAKAQLTDLVRRAEAGDDIVLTRHGQPVMRLVPVQREVSFQHKCDLIDRLSKSAAAKAKPGATAERSQDFLYDEDGLPK